MRRFFALLTLLITFPVLGQGAPMSPVVSRGDLLKIRQYKTVGDITYYVDPLGNDGNSCLSSGTGACLTLQAVCNKAAAQIWNTVVINLATGNYSGAVCAGFQVHPAQSGGTNSVSIVGTLVTATLAAGTPTGTLTAFSAASGTTQAVFTDGTQTWTVNALRGLLIEITAGTGSGVNSIWQIVANTGTTITTTGSPTASAAGATYVIRDWGSVINTAVPAEAGGPFAISNMGATGLRLAAGMNGGNFGTTFNVQKVAFVFTSNSTSGVDLEDQSRIYLRWNKYQSSGTFFVPVRITLGGFVTVHTSWMNMTSSAIGISMGGVATIGGGLTTSGVFFQGGTTGISASAPILQIGSSYWLGQTSQAVVVSNSIVGTTQFTSSRIDCNSTGAHAIRLIAGATSGGPNVAVIGMSNVDISNCGAAFTMQSANAQAQISGVTGTGNTTAYALTQGARMEITSTSTVTGGTEISMDGDTWTLAQLRAFSPKQIVNALTQSSIMEP